MSNIKDGQVIKPTVNLIPYDPDERKFELEAPEVNAKITAMITDEKRELKNFSSEGYVLSDPYEINPYTYFIYLLNFILYYFHYYVGCMLQSLGQRVLSMREKSLNL